MSTRPVDQLPASRTARAADDEGNARPARRAEKLGNLAFHHPSRAQRLGRTEVGRAGVGGPGIDRDDIGLEAHAAGQGLRVEAVAQGAGGGQDADHLDRGSRPRSESHRLYASRGAHPLFRKVAFVGKLEVGDNLRMRPATLPLALSAITAMPSIIESGTALVPHQPEFRRDVAELRGQVVPVESQTQADGSRMLWIDLYESIQVNERVQIS